MNLELLEKFQTAVVGFVGFVGVIITLIANAWLARRRDKEMRAHEKEVLSRALAAELRSYCRSVPLIAEQKTMERPEPNMGSLLIPALSATPIFDANLEKLGVLDDDQVSSVLEAYMVLKEWDRALVLFSVSVRKGGEAVQWVAEIG